MIKYINPEQNLLETPLRRWIFVSPHFDDAVLSCGGLISDLTRQGTPVEIWTVCAGDLPPGKISALAEGWNNKWKLRNTDEIMALRRLEDSVAIATVGASAVYLPIPDCIYRKTIFGCFLYPRKIYTSINPFELTITFRVASLFKAQLNAQDTVVSPLAISGHVDHIMTRKSLERLGKQLLYYADIPYLLRNPDYLAKKTNGMTAELYPVSDSGLRAWQDGIAAYASQISMLFTNNAIMHREIQAYRDAQGGIQLWKFGYCQ